MDASRPILVIPDIQEPFSHDRALDFCRYLKRHFNVPDENVLNVGDETDAYWGGSWPKSPDVDHTPRGEIRAARERIRQWADVFPKMDVAISNHGLRWMKKASGAEIPSEVIRSYQEIFAIPAGWRYKEEWRYESLKHPFRMIHGMGYSGMNGHINAAKDSGISTVIGHLHSFGGVNRIHTMGGKEIWAMNAGCLIDVDAYAFEYGKYSRAKPTLGAGVIFSQGSTPIWYPLSTYTEINA